MDLYTFHKEGTVKSLMSLWSCTAEEMAVRCCTSATRDINTVAGRFEHEGLSFLAITLANFGKATQKWLDQGQVVPSDVPGFKVTPGRRTGLPSFLRGFLERVFDPCTGVLLDDYDIEAISAILQLTLSFSKIALPPDPLSGNGTQVVSPERRERAMHEYVECEQEVKASDLARSAKMYTDFCRMSDMLFARAFTLVDREVYEEKLVPKHGPGATADRLSSNGKYDQRTWPARLEEHFPFVEYALPSHSYYSELEDVDFLEPGAETPVRVITVPKTLKTPRIIAIEPTAMQYAQQAVLRSLLDALGQDDFLNRVIGFTDQDPNREMACKGSLSGELATLDLSEASDRVSNQLVRAMLRNHPHLLGVVDGSRSRKADVPGHGVIRLAKFASMGSALCFPIEAMVFLTLILLGIEDELSTTLTPRTLYKFQEQVRVFGDDIIVPSRHVLSVVQRLENFGSKVNLSKSFWSGNFRESCGREYFQGQDVSTVKVREVLATRRQDANGVIAMVALRNQFYWAGYWGTTRWLDSRLRKLLKHFPNVEPSSPLLGRECALGYQAESIHPDYQSPLVRGWYVVAESPPDELEGPGALLKCFLRAEALSRAEKANPPGKGNGAFAVALPGDDEHLKRSGRPKRVSIMLGRRSPF